MIKYNNLKQERVNALFKYFQNINSEFLNNGMISRLFICKDQISERNHFFFLLFFKHLHHICLGLLSGRTYAANIIYTKSCS